MKARYYAGIVLAGFAAAGFTVSGELTTGVLVVLGLALVAVAGPHLVEQLDLGPLSLDFADDEDATPGD